MDSETIETVLHEILGDLKESNRLNKENGALAFEIKDRLISLEKKLDSREKTSSIDTRPIEQIVSKGMNNITILIEESKDKRRSSIQFKFFPDYNTVEYYKIVYGRILFWVVMLFITKYLYLLGSLWISRNYDDQRYKKAWDNLYQLQGKSSQKMMQKILGKD